MTGRHLHTGLHRTLRPLLALLGFLTALAADAQSGFVPPENLDPDRGSPSLDASFDREAWLVYTYEISPEGRVVDATIHSSNGIPEVDQSMLAQIRAMRFRPATRDGQPVAVPVGPVVYTWILDTQREMTPAFTETYEAAWEKFRAEDYDGAFDLAAKLKEMPGRNAYEEVKFQILAASIANRWDDAAAEMQHLQRVVELQNLADRNLFENPYVPQQHFALMLERIHTLQLGNNQLADAQATFNRLMMRGTAEEVTRRVQTAQQDAQRDFLARSVVGIKGELTPLYRGGPGNWETRLTRERFRLADVRGDVSWLYLSCLGNEQRLPYPTASAWSVPAGWKECKVEIGGRAGTRFELQQLAQGAS